MLAQRVLTALVVCSSLTEAKKMRGVSTSYKRFYRERKSFLCIDGSKLIAFDRVNDDYCDCADASDEPGTAACPNGRFYCVNLGFRPHYIPSSRVNDGICDCCDGSDEFSSRTQCVNKCRELCEKERSDVETRMRAVSEGLVMKRALIEEGRVILQEKQAQLRDLQKVAEDLRSKVGISRKKKLKAEAEKEKLEKARKLQLKSIGGQSVTPGAVPPAGRMKVEEEPQRVMRPGEVEEKSEIQKEQDSVKTSSDEDPVIKAVQSAVESATAELQKLEEAYETVQMEIREVEEKLNIDYGPEQEFVFLLNRCVQLTVYEYVYSLCPFSQVTQRDSVGTEIILGRWERWLGTPDSPYSRMKYSDGGTCWEGPQRSTTVSLLCGTETELRSVKEPSKCVYTMELQTPAACSLNAPPRSLHNEL